MAIPETYPLTCESCLGYGKYNEYTGSPIVEASDPDAENMKECEFCGGTGTVYIHFDPETGVLSVPNFSDDRMDKLKGGEAIQEILFYVEEKYITSQQAYGMISAIKEKEV